MVFYFHGSIALVGQALLTVLILQSHSDTPRSVKLLWKGDRPVVGISTWQAQNSQQTDIHDPGGIRTYIPSKRAAADPRLGRHDHWNRPL